MKYHGRELGATLVAIACAQAQAAPSQCSGTQHVDAVTRAYLPTGFVQAQSRMVQTDGHVTQLRRYQAQGQSQPRLGSVHFSTLANAGGCTIGFIRLAPSLATREPLTQEEALTIAGRFLRIHAPDLLADYTLHSVKAYSENFQVSGRRQTVHGLNVKMRNRTDGTWFWVVLGAHKQVMLFERDLVWSNLRFARATERWLYDDWRARQ